MHFGVVRSGVLAASVLFLPASCALQTCPSKSVAAEAAPNPAGSFKPGDEFLLVECIVGDKLQQTTTGLVIAENDQRSYVLISDVRSEADPKDSAKTTEVRYRAILGPHADGRRVDLEKITAVDRRYVIAAATKQTLPPPVPLRPLPELAAGMKLTFVGVPAAPQQQVKWEIVRREVPIGPPGFLRGEFGVPLGISAGRGLLLGADGTVVALAESGHRGYVALPTTFLSRILNPSISAMRTLVTRDQNEYVVEFAVQTVDPFQSKLVPRILVAFPAESERNGHDWAMLTQHGKFAVVGGAWQKPEGATEIALEPVTQPDPAFDLPPAPSALAHASYWYGVYRCPANEAPLFLYSCAFADASGAIKTRENESHIKLTATEAETIRYVHPLAQYGGGTPVARRSPPEESSPAPAALPYPTADDIAGIVETVGAAPVGAADAAVIIIAELNGRPFGSQTGLVFHADTERAYIVAKPASNQMPQGDLVQRTTTYSAVVGSGPQKRRVVLERLSPLGGEMVFAGPKSELPAPLPRRPEVEPSVGTKLLLIGCETEPRIATPAVRRRTIEGVVSGVFRDPKTFERRWTFETTSGAMITHGLLTTTDGKLVAIATPDVERPCTTAGFLHFSASPLSTLNAVANARTADIRCAARVLEGRARFTIIVRPDDPLSRLSRLRLLVTTKFTGLVPPSIHEGDVAYSVFPDDMKITVVDGAWTDKPEDGLEVDLEPLDRVDPLFDFRTDSERLPLGKAFVAKFSLPVKDQVPVACQLVEVAADGRYTPIGKTTPGVVYHNGLETYGLLLSASTARESSSDRHPMLPKRPDGNMDLTSPLFALEPDELPKAKTHELRPEAKQRPLTSKFIDQKSFGEATLDIELGASAENPKSDSPPRAPAAISADGRLLYVVDGKNRLHRIDASTWTETVELQFDQPCVGLSISAAGVLATMSKTDEVLIIDGDTLALRRVVTVPQVSGTIASPRLSKFFATLPYKLMMFDGAGDHPPQSIGQAHLRTAGLPVNDAIGKAVGVFSLDGSRFIYGHDRLGCFRVDGTSLLFDGAATARIEKPAGLSVSGNGRYFSLVVNVIGKPNRHVAIYDSTNPRAPPRIVTYYSPATAACVLNDGGLLLASSYRILRYDPSGKQISETSVDEGHAELLIALPDENRFVCWGNRLTVFDFDKSRLKAVADAAAQK